MRKILDMSPGWMLFAGFLALLLAGILLGGFESAWQNGRLICIDCIGLFQLGETGKVIGFAITVLLAALFSLMLTAVIHRAVTGGNGRAGK